MGGVLMLYNKDVIGSPGQRSMGGLSRFTAFLLGSLLTAALWLVAPGACWRGCQRPESVPLPAVKGQLHAAQGSATRPSQLPPVPWEPILDAEQLERGMQFYGSGRRIERVAAKLLAGQPIKAFTVGGSVTRGAGASSPETSYPARFFQFINTTFPHRDHVLANKGIGGTNSGIFAVCADKLLPPDSDLVVVEFTFNELPDRPYTDPPRMGFEQLLRKLARMPGAPAVLVLHHYAWWHSWGDGVKGGLYYRAAEQQITTMAQYYDMPSPSVRTAVYHEMRAGIAPFKVTHVTKPGQVAPAGLTLPLAEAGTEDEYFYYDQVHPKDVGHKVLAELLAGVVMRAAERVASGSSDTTAADAAAGGQAAAGQAAADGSDGGSSSGLPNGTAVELPPPMISGNGDYASTLCAMQEEFESVATQKHGFAFKPERPDAATFVDQKWGYTGHSPGDWVELEFSTQAGSEKVQGPATVFLTYLRSYEGMGSAQVECRSGCKCKPGVLNGSWRRKVSLTQLYSLKATQHPKCTVRVTILEPEGGLAAQGKGSSSGGSKFQLTAVMASHIPMALGSTQTEDLMAR